MEIHPYILTFLFGINIIKSFEKKITMNKNEYKLKKEKEKKRKKGKDKNAKIERKISFVANTRMITKLSLTLWLRHSRCPGFS